MATTTTAVNACSAVITIDDDAGTPTPISGSSTSVSISGTTELGDYKVFADSWRYRLACGQDWEMSIEAVYTTASGEVEALDLLRTWWLSQTTIGAYKVARDIQIDMPDSTSGSDRYTGEVFLESLDFGELSASEPGPVMVSATFKPSGALTHAKIV